MPKFKFGAEINFCGEYGLEPNFVLDFVPKLTFGAEVTSVPKLLVPNIDRLSGVQMTHRGFRWLIGGTDD